MSVCIYTFVLVTQNAFRNFPAQYYSAQLWPVCLSVPIFTQPLIDCTIPPPASQSTKNKMCLDFYKFCPKNFSL